MKDIQSLAEYNSKKPLHLNSASVFFSEQKITSVNGEATIDWNKSNKASMVLTEDVTLSFIDPVGNGNLLLKVTQDNNAGHTIIFPSSVKWLGSAPVWTEGGANKTIIIGFYFDGTTYWAQASDWEQ